MLIYVVKWKPCKFLNSAQVRGAAYCQASRVNSVAETEHYKLVVEGASPSRGIMTFDELHRLVRLASNGCYVRYWLNWNYPQETNIFVVSFIDIDNNGKAVSAKMYEPDLPEFIAKWDLGGIVHYVFEKEK